ncbi:hypothetical protein GCM10010344_02130 [Streptomyces bluensis]|nr:hypothetical protein GCM10010344_02130 [Streptomyces bluensis]
MKTVVEPFVVRAQPSGTFTVKPAKPLDGRNATYAWLSGMSPGGLLSVGAAFGADPVDDLGVEDAVLDPDREPEPDAAPEHPAVTAEASSSPAATAADFRGYVIALALQRMPGTGRSRPRR